NLDAKLRVQMRSEIARIQRDLATTTIYVTHDQIEAMTMGTHVAVMKKGDLQQVGPPQTLYDKPANLFVAGFIGSPAMNIVEASIGRDNGSVVAEFAGIRLTVDEAVLGERPALTKYDGRRVILGIRPETIEDAELAREAPEDRCFSAVVDLRETVGSEVFAHFTVAAPPVLTEDAKELAYDQGAEMLQKLEAAASEERTTFVARLHARTSARDGGRVRLFVDTRTLHFFDPETGNGIYGDGTP
ncbi:MAG: ABC transporter ATP-binding protein, partial [Actinobacteria bacterium]|nr:ABC transporter ATP-binding protein [Actinomycetota bacterium]